MDEGAGVGRRAGTVAGVGGDGDGLAFVIGAVAVGMMGVAVGVGDDVAIAVGVRVAVALGEGDGVLVAVAVAVEMFVAVLVGVAVAVFVPVGVLVAVSVGVRVADAVTVTVDSGVSNGADGRPGETRFDAWAGSVDAPCVDALCKAAPGSMEPGEAAARAVWREGGTALLAPGIVTIVILKNVMRPMVAPRALRCAAPERRVMLMCTFLSESDQPCRLP